MPVRPGSTTFPQASPGDFARFQARAWSDPELAARLRAHADAAAFAAAVVAEGQRAGFRFDEAAVLAAVADGRRRWLERWLA